MTERLQLIIGADGLIGRALTARLREAGRQVIGTSRRSVIKDGLHLDLAQPIDTSGLPPNIGVAYLLAGTTAMAACEADPVGTHRINVKHTLDLARALHDRGAHVIAVSTNLVFDGLVVRVPAGAPLTPVNVYARQKADLEQGLAAFGGRTTILRTTKIAEGLIGLLTDWSTKLEAGEVIRPFGDLVCAPLPLAYIVEALARIADQHAEGLCQISADRDISYGAVAMSLAEAIGGNAQHCVREVTSVEMGMTLPARPKHTTLDSAETEARLGLLPVTSADVVNALIARIVECRQRLRRSVDPEALQVCLR